MVASLAEEGGCRLTFCPSTKKATPACGLTLSSRGVCGCVLLSATCATASAAASPAAAVGGLGRAGGRQGQGVGGCAARPQQGGSLREERGASQEGGPGVRRIVLRLLRYRFLLLLFLPGLLVVSLLTLPVLLPRVAAATERFFLFFLCRRVLVAAAAASAAAGDHVTVVAVVCCFAWGREKAELTAQIEGLHDRQRKDQQKLAEVRHDMCVRREDTIIVFF